MNVLVLLSGFGPYKVTGLTFLQDTLIGLQKKGIHITILTPIYGHTSKGWENWYKSLENKYGIKIIPIVSNKFITRNFNLHLMITPFLVTIRAIKLLKQNNFDIIHDVSSTPIILLRSLIMKLFTKAAIVYSLPVYNETFLGKLNWIKIFNFADHYVIPSTEMSKNLEEMGINKNKITFIPPGIDLNRFNKKITSSKSRSTLNLPKNKVIYTYFGPLTETKGVLTIIKALARISKDSFFARNCHFVIYTNDYKSSDTFKKYFRELDKYPFLSIRNELVDIPTLLSASDCIVITPKSLHGTTIPPISVLEAIAANKSLVTTHLVGISELSRIYNKITLIPKGDFRKLLKIINSELITKANEKKYYLKKYALENTIKDYQYLYKNLYAKKQ